MTSTDIVTLLTAVIAGFTAIYVARIDHAQKKLKEPVERTYNAVNGGRLDRMEKSLFDLVGKVAALVSKLEIAESDRENEKQMRAKEMLKLRDRVEVLEMEQKIRAKTADDTRD